MKKLDYTDMLADFVVYSPEDERAIGAWDRLVDVEEKARLKHIDDHTPVTVVIHHPETGEIPQIVRVGKMDSKRQHLAWPGHDYIHAPSDMLHVHPEHHIVDVKTKKIVPRLHPTLKDVTHKELEMRHHATIEKFQHGDHEYHAHDESLKDMVIASVIGGEIQVNGGDHVHHEPDEAKAVLAKLSTMRSTNRKKLSALVVKIKAAKTKRELSEISW